MAVNINHATGEVRCTACGGGYCDHVDRLARRFSLYASIPEVRATPAPGGHGSAADFFREHHRLLVRGAERPLCDRLDERPLRDTKDND